MIKTIELINFQGHKHTKIDLHPNINIISGKSDSGKTSIIRALDAVINNNNNCDDYIYRNQKKYEVQIVIGNDSITRERGNNNIYFLNGESFKSFGYDVPDEIKQILNFSDVNLQNQLDSPFLLSQSGGEISRFFNKMINIDIIDQAISNIEKMRKEENRNIKTTQSQIDEYNLKLEQFKYLDKLEKKLKKLDKKNNLFNKLKEKSNKLYSIIESLNIIDIEKKEYETKLKLENNIKKVNIKLDKLFEIMDLYNDLDDRLEKLESVNNELKSLPDISKLRSNIKIIKEKNKKLSSIIDKRKRLFSLVNELSITRTTIGNYIFSIADIKEALIGILPDLCPVCKSPINKENFV